MEDDLLQIQQELQAVKKALKGGGSFLGMKDVTLQRYLLQLSEKENLVMSRQFNLGDVQAGDVVAGGVADLKPARPPPPGEKRTFDKESAESVTAHMRDYESDVKDCALTLRALSALAYANASVVSEDALGIALRLGQLHPKENAVQLALVRLLCNAAYVHEHCSETAGDRSCSVYSFGHHVAEDVDGRWRKSKRSPCSHSCC